MSKIRTVEYVRQMNEISDYFDIIDQKGEGTFASVFTVRDKTDENSEIYAMKMIIPTVELRRVENELRALRQLEGKHGVIKLISAMRVRDHIFILTPFIDYVAFTYYYRSFDEREIRRYLLHLLRALQHVHRYGIIHRDVKPTNFLLDRRTRRYTLVDFGLAHSQTCGDLDQTWNPNTEAQVYQQTKRRKMVPQGEESLCPPPKSVRVIDRGSTLVFNPGNAPEKAPPQNPPLFPRLSTSCLSSNTGSQNLNSFPSLGQVNSEECGCGNRLTTCRGCKSLPKGTPARRGGTLGFRAPEVMMRCVNQTIAVDVWAVGVIFLSFLTGRYPFIKVDDDFEVLHAFCHLLGYERMQQGAHSVGKKILIDPRPPQLGDKETPLQYMRCRLVAMRRMERRLQISIKENRLDTFCDGVALPNNHRFPLTAYDLCVRLLEPSPIRRITAEEAIKHAFISPRQTSSKSNATTKIAALDPASSK